MHGPQPAPDLRRPVLRAGILHADLCIIGAGSGGLSVAAGAIQMGASVVLIEKGAMGGDCLNAGCVPSKALLAAAHAAEGVRRASRFGVHAPAPHVAFHEVHAHVHGVIAAIAPHDSVARFEGLGVTVIPGTARFTDPATVEVNGQPVRARRFVIATGSHAAVPPIPGLAEAGFLTNETIFDLTTAPDHLIVIGGGPIGVEMAQAHRRLGCAVTIIEAQTLLARDEPEAVAVLRARLLAEGVTIHEGVGVTAVGREGGEAVVTLAHGATLRGSHLLVATGRRPTIEGLGLEAAGIASTPRGITVDRRLRTSNRRVFAIGDVTGGAQFTHRAGYHAGIVIRNALFGLPARVDETALPWVTFTDPELAHVGLTEAEARRADHDIRILTWPLDQNDRAQAERATDGLVKAIVTPRGRILGATIVGARAGELIGTWGVAIAGRLSIGTLAATMAPYPTYSEVTKRAAGSFYTPTLFSPRTRRLVQLIQRILP